jgi:hypothetical protein
MDATISGVTANYINTFIPTYYGPATSSGNAPQSATPTPGVSQQGQSVLDQMDAVVQQAKAEPKEWAAQQLTEAVAETRILKELGGALTPEQQAEQATRIAKKIANASQAYASANGSNTAGSALATTAGAAVSPTSIAAAIDSPATGTAADPGALTVDNTANIPPQTLVQELASSPSAFFGLAADALGTLKKIETKAVNTMEESDDPKQRKKGLKLAEAFNKAVNDTESAAASVAQSEAGGGSDGGGDAGQAIGTTTTTLSVAVTTTTVSVSLTV